jgi:hypothetical protein
MLDLARIVVLYWIHGLGRFDSNKAIVGLVAFLLSFELIVLG